MGRYSAAVRLSIQDVRAFGCLSLKTALKIFVMQLAWCESLYAARHPGQRPTKTTSVKVDDSRADSGGGEKYIPPL